ncbi:hypothetical protein LI951_12450 [Enterococcus sp. BWT-B8]|nr:hypothetical protein [Enterococcus sp. BWT-B8]MCB5952880.1 hypothetical protein [Enterococcus sp. BWT-B8]
MRVHLIEDDAALPRLLQTAIEKYAFEVVPANEFEHLKNEFQQQQPDFG